MNIELQIGGYVIQQGDKNPCSHPEQLWLYNEVGEGMEVRVKQLEAALDIFFKEHF